MNVEKYRATANKLIRNPDDTDALVDQFARQLGVAIEGFDLRLRHVAKSV